jgi:hypothetical protein
MDHSADRYQGPTRRAIETDHHSSRSSPDVQVTAKVFEAPAARRGGQCLHTAGPSERDRRVIDYAPPRPIDLHDAPSGVRQIEVYGSIVARHSQRNVALAPSKHAADSRCRTASIIAWRLGVLWRSRQKIMRQPRSELAGANRPHLAMAAAAGVYLDPGVRRSVPVMKSSVESSARSTRMTDCVT